MSRHRLPTRLARVTIAAALCASAGTAVATAQAPNTSASGTGTVITVHPGQGEHPISDRIFGANNNYAADGSGLFDVATHRVYPRFVRQVERSGFNALRFPGGTMANLYHFTRAIGPEDARTPNTNGVLADPEALDNDFGPDEYGRLLDQTGMRGNLVLNFATGTPREAADFVEYMTARRGTNPGGGVAWARRRAADGHPAPYPVDTFEIGNEMNDAGQAYWMGGTSHTSCSFAVDCLYAHGGSTQFVDQPVVGRADWTQPASSTSAGTPHQKFYARYAPVAAGTDTVQVAGATWSRVGRLRSAGADEHVYTIDDATGAIRFGDGTHGAIPPQGAAVTISYTSGRHPGFDAFYRAVKRVDPNGRVCSSVDTEEFVRLMGSTHPYDCLVRHEYSTGPTGAVAAGDYHDQLMAIAPKLGSDLAGFQQTIRDYAGARARHITTMVTEYGELGAGAPTGTTHYHLSLDQGLYVANLLEQWARLGVPVAEKAKLTDYVFSPAPPATQSVGFPENAMIAGPGPDSVVEPTAQVMGILSRSTGETFVPSTVRDNPERTTADGSSLPALTTLASRTGRRYSVAVVNQDRSDDVRATLSGRFLRGERRARVCTVDGPSYLSYNSPSQRHAVTRTCRSRSIEKPITYPAHSVTTVAVLGRS